MESTSVSEKGPSIGPEAATDGRKNPKVTTLDGLAKSCDAKSFASPNGSFAGS